MTQTVNDSAQNSTHRKDYAERIERLRPHQFQPGQSGNPGGRPVKIKEAENILLESLKKATEKLSKLVDSEDDRVSLQASVQVVERMMGKAVQKVETKDTSDAKEMSEDDLANIATAGSQGTPETQESQTQPN